MFNKHTDTRLETLICGELRTAKEQHGEIFSSPHEAYAVMLEEFEEAYEDLKKVEDALSLIWSGVKNDTCDSEGVKMARSSAKSAAAELLQLCAVCDKMKGAVEK